MVILSFHRMHCRSSYVPLDRREAPVDAPRSLAGRLSVSTDYPIDHVQAFIRHTKVRYCLLSTTTIFEPLLKALVVSWYSSTPVVRSTFSNHAPP